MKKLTTDKNELESYLKDQGWLQSNESIVHVEKPGEGNMNFTLRVDTGDRTLIVKQSREYVEKYPQVPAPVERVLRESEFYHLISVNEQLKAMMPSILGLDAQNSVMAMQDLGAGSDFTFLYQENQVIEEQDLLEIMGFAATLHSTCKAGDVHKIIQNSAMRKLNHEHMFIYPYLAENGLNLDDILPGLKSMTKEYKQNKDLKSAVKAMGDRYLQDGDTLLHGDYFPGSWLKTSNGIKIIDPEFCFFGSAEFEIGVTVAHLKMANQPSDLIEKALSVYQSKTNLNDTLRRKYTATEIFRRILGLAQLPLTIGLEKRAELLKESSEALLR